MKETEQYQLMWKKYLPVITLKLKQVIRSNEPSFIGMYRFEFHNSGKKRRVGYQFELHMNKGRAQSAATHSAVAKELLTVLKENASVQSLLATGDFMFSLNTDFILSIHKKAEPEAAQSAAT